MSISRPGSSNPYARPALPEPELRILQEWLRRAVPGCRLCRALAPRLQPQPAAIWAVGSVTIDDVDRFASGDR
jgi:hypothetical protein